MTNINKSQREQLEVQSFLAKAAREKLLNFCQLINPKYEAIWFHELIAEKLEKALDAAMNKGKARIILSIPPRHGKAFEVNTPILTINGWKKIKDIVIGDYVFDENGLPTRVINKSEIWKNRILYNVSTDDGFEVLADENHEWSCRMDRKRKNTRTIWETKKLADRSSRRKPMIDLCKPLYYKDKELPIGPYTLGVWLGDGTSSDGSWTCEEMDENIMSKWIIDEGFGVRKQNKKFGYGILGLKNKLRINNLINNKHIPKEYFSASIAQRKLLLQGLIDTDGYIAKDGQVEFCSVNKRLAEDVRDLVVSLGVKASFIFGRATILGKDFGEKYRVLFYMKDAARLPRKSIFSKDGTRSPNRYLSFEKCGIGDTVCIEVENKSHLFLIGKGLLVTHNSQLASIYFPAWALGKYPDIKFILSTYGAELAEELGMKTRDVVNSEEYKIIFKDINLRQDSKAKAKWITNKDGSFTSVGIGGGITGKGGNCIIIDDPHKDRQEAESPVMRDRAWEYFQSTLYSRLEGAGAVVVIMQRWHQDDLVGRLLEEQEKLKLSGMPYDEWEVIKFPAIAEEDEVINGIKVRSIGEPLWESKFPLPVLKNIAAKSIYNWSSQYMQDPILAVNQEFREHMFKYYDEEDLKGKYLRYYTFVDPAISQKKEADNTVVLTVAKEINGPNFYRIREDAGHFTPTQTIDLIFQHTTEYRSDAYIEVTAYQMALKYAVIEEQKKRGIYFLVREVKSSTQKEMRIRGLLPLYNAGVIHHRRSDFDYERELLAFPRGKRDDRIDCMSNINLTYNTFGSESVKQYKKKFTGYFRNK